MLAIDKELGGVRSGPNFWDVLGRDAVGDGKVTGTRWNGFVAKIDVDHIEVTLRSEDWPSHEVGAWIGRSHIDEDVLERLGIGVCISLIFCEDDNGSRIDIRLIDANQA